jgi:hypothetical protein
MRSRYFIFLLLCFGSLGAQVISTQDSIRLLPEQIRSIEILNIGACMPVNDFGKHEKSSTSGFAVPGIKLDAGFNIQLYRHLGIKSMLMWQNNQLDANKYKKDLKAENPANSYTISSGGWNNFSLFIGVYNNFNIGKSFHIQPYILGGFNYGISPDVEVTVLDSLQFLSNISQKKGHAWNFCYGGGLDLKVDVANDYQFTFGVSGFYCELKFNGVRVENSFKNSVYYFNAYQPIQTLGFKVGVAKVLR